MKKLTLRSKEEVFLSDISENEPIFVKKDGKLCGMVIKENDRWITKVGGSAGSHGYYGTRLECLEYGANRLNHEYFIED